MIRLVRISTCPICGKDVTSNQLTLWRKVNGEPARVHRLCFSSGVPSTEASRADEPTTGDQT